MLATAAGFFYETGMETVDQQPGGTGKEKDPSERAEVGGRGRSVLYVCFNDGAGNYVDTDWKWFKCWRCGSLGYV
jgi:hypothetical protein